MTGTSLAATYGPIAGADLEAELAQPRTADGDAQDAAVLERDGGAHALPFASGGAFGRAPRDDDDDRRGAGDASVRLTRVSKRYGERTVLADVDLAIERGGFVSIVGAAAAAGSFQGCASLRNSRRRAPARSSSAETAAACSIRGSCIRTRACCRGRPYCRT